MSIIREKNGFHIKKTYKGRYTYDVHENCLIFKAPHPLSIYIQNSSTLLTLDVQF